MTTVLVLNTKETVIIDDDVAEWASKYNWLSCLSMTTAGISVVAVAKIGSDLVYLHEHILGLRRPKGAQHGPSVIFKDGNTLNMQRANMFIKEY